MSGSSSHARLSSLHISKTLKINVKIPDIDEERFQQTCSRQDYKDKEAVRLRAALLRIEVKRSEVVGESQDLLVSDYLKRGNEISWQLFQNKYWRPK